MATRTYNRVACPRCGESVSTNAVKRHQSGARCKANALAILFESSGYVRTSYYLYNVVKSCELDAVAAPTKYVRGFQGRRHTVSDQFWIPTWVDVIIENQRWSGGSKSRRSTNELKERLLKAAKSEGGKVAAILKATE